MKTRLIAPLAAMLFGLSACTFEEAPYTSLQVQFAVGAPLYYAGGPVTWHYYDGYTYHLIDHHGRFVGYAYYDYDHFYRIADVFGNIVYFLRWYSGGWRIHDHRNRHLGFIHSDNHGNYWLADTGGHRHGAMRGWGRSGKHGHAHAGRHDDRVEHRDSRHRYDAERNRWRDKKHDAEIRRRQEHATHSVDRDGKQRRYNDQTREEDRIERARERHERGDDRDRDGQRIQGNSVAPATVAPSPRRRLPGNEDLMIADPLGQGKAGAKSRRRGEPGLTTPPPQRATTPAQPRRRRQQVTEPEAPRATTPARRRQRQQVTEPEAPRATTPARRRPRAVEPQAPRPAPPQAVTPKPKQAAPKPAVKPADKPAAKPKGKKPAKEDDGNKGKKGKKGNRDKD